MNIIPFLSAVVFSSSGGNGGGFFQAILFLFVAGLILGLLLWLLSVAPFIPAPFKSILTFIIYFVAVLILINFLLGLVGHSFIAFN